MATAAEESDKNRMLNWIPFVQSYAKQHGLQYGQALAAAKPAYAAYREESVAKGLLKAAPMPRKAVLPQKPIQTNKSKKSKKEAGGDNAMDVSTTPKMKKKKAKATMPPILDGNASNSDDDDDEAVYERKVIYQKKAKQQQQKKRKRDPPSELEVAVAPIIGKKRKTAKAAKQQQVQKAVGPQGAALSSVYDLDLVSNDSLSSSLFQKQEASAAMENPIDEEEDFHYLSSDGEWSPEF